MSVIKGDEWWDILEKLKKICNKASILHRLMIGSLMKVGMNEVRCWYSCLWCLVKKFTIIWMKQQNDWIDLSFKTIPLCDERIVLKFAQEWCLHPFVVIISRMNKQVFLMAYRMLYRIWIWNSDWTFEIFCHQV